MKKLEKGDWIKCHNEADLKNWLAYLGDKGFGAVAAPGLYIRITSEPKKKGDQEEAAKAMNEEVIEW